MELAAEIADGKHDNELDVRPKYLGGRIGTVQSKRGTKLVVDLEVPAGRYSAGVLVPADLLEPA